MEEKKFGVLPEVYDLAEELYKLYRIAYFRIEPMASYIITRKVKNVKMIENTLDNILDIPTDEAYELFVSLCNYYSTIDKEGAKFYLDSWNEIYGEDKPKVRKKDYK